MKGVISAGDPLTAKAGAEILKRGGNAFDAALAAMMAAPMSEPILTSIGGGGFMLAYKAGERPVLYDFFVDVPLQKADKKDIDFGPVEVDFGTAVQEFHIGSASIAVPGMAAGIDAIHHDLATLDMKEIIKPAQNYAREGVILSKMQASFVKLLEPILLSTESSRNLFAPTGKLIDESSPWNNLDYGDFLDNFAKNGAKIFYQGQLADTIDMLSRKHGGLIQKNDLESYRVEKRDPIIFDYRNKRIATNPPPSAGGILIAFALEMLSKGPSFLSFDSTEYIAELIESMAITMEFRKKYIDAHLHQPDLSNVVNNSALIVEFLEQKREKVNLWGNTTHISVIDAEGNAASVTSTNGEGSGQILPGTGIMLNNMLGEEDLNPHGFFKWPAGVRLPSMMAPTMVFDGEDPLLILGSAGSNRIRSAITEVIERYVRFDEPIKQAISAPRIHFEKGEVFIEPGFSERVINAISQKYKLSVFDELNLFFGGVNAVTGHYNGSADPRRGGATIVVD